MSDSEKIDSVVSEEKVVIDLNANKKSESKSNEEEEVKPNYTVIPEKRIDELTDEDKKILNNNARSGIDNPYYAVKLFKNGNTRICKKKKNSISKEAVESNGERTIRNQNGDKKLYMTDNQLIWEHLFELENKYNTLYRKHKKLKSKYNDLYIEDDISTPNAFVNVDEVKNEQQPEVKNERTKCPELRERLPHEDEQQPEHQQQPQQPQEPLIQRNPLSWRQALMQRTRNSHMN